MTYIDTYVYDEPSVLIPRKGSLDKLYYVDVPFWTVDTIFYTKISKIVSPRFVFFYLQTQHLERLNKAGGVPSLTKSVLNKILIPVPPLKIQNEIIKFLDDFTELTVELIEQLMTELTLRKKQYNFYCKKLLTLSSDIRQNKVGDIFNLQNGYTPSKKQSLYWENGTIPWYRMEDIRLNGRILYDAVQHIHLSAVKGRLYPANSILMATTATIGEYALIKRPALSNQQMINFSIKEKFKETLDAKFAFYYFHVFAEWCKKNANQSGGMPIITTAKLKTFSFPVPPLEVQQKIVSILDRFDALCNDLTRGLPAEIVARKRQYEHYRDKLLTFPRVQAEGSV